MSTSSRTPAAHIASQFRGRKMPQGLPAISLLGPRFSGKSACLGDISKLLGKRKNDIATAIPVLVDLETLGHGSHEELARRLTAFLGSQRGIPSRSPEEAAIEGGRMAACLRQIGRLGRGTVFLVDHLDAVPAAFAREIVRSFRVAFDQRSVFEEYARIGVVFAGSVSLSLLRRTGESAFITEFVAMPSVSREAQLVGVQRYWPAGTELPASVAAAIAEVSGGERLFVDLLVEALGPSAKRSEMLLAADAIDRAIDAACRLESELFRELTLALLIDSELCELVKQVLQRGDGQIERRDFTPDIDVFSLSGALVLITRDGGTARYAFRNKIVRQFVTHLQLWLEQPAQHAPSRAVVALVHEFDEIWQAFRSAPRIWSAMRHLGELWALLVGTRTTPEAVHVRLALHDPDTPVYWLSSSASVIAADASISLLPPTEAAVRSSIEGDERVPCVAFDTTHVSVAASATNDHASLTIAITQATRGTRRIREHTLALWQCALDSWSRVLTISALAEIGRHLMTQTGRGRPADADAMDATAVPRSDERSAMGGRLKLDTRRTLTTRLTTIASPGTQAAEFVADLVSRAEIPDGWKGQAVAGARGSLDDAAWSLIRLLEERGRVSAATPYSALAVVLAANAERVGLEDRELFRRAIAELQNTSDLQLLDDIQRLDTDTTDARESVWRDG